MIAHGPVLSQRLAEAQAAQRQMVAGLDRASRPMDRLWRSNTAAVHDVKHALTARECRGRQAFWSEVLRVVAATKPSGVELVAIKSAWTDAGYAVLLCGTISANRQAEVIANDWLGKLRQCGRFSQVRLDRLQRAGANDLNGPIAVHIACTMKRDTDEAMAVQD
jgi:hypothetical protein